MLRSAIPAGNDYKALSSTQWNVTFSPTAFAIDVDTKNKTTRWKLKQTIRIAYLRTRMAFICSAKLILPDRILRRSPRILERLSRAAVDAVSLSGFLKISLEIRESCDGRQTLSFKLSKRRRSYLLARFGCTTWFFAK
jgi:hypothetical protein